MEWISVDERLPENGCVSFFWAVEKYPSPHMVEYMGWRDGDRWKKIVQDGMDGYMVYVDDVCYWMPWPRLPPVPEKYLTT